MVLAAWVTLGVPLLPVGLPGVMRVAMAQPNAAPANASDLARIVADGTLPEAQRIAAAQALLSQCDATSPREGAIRLLAEPITPATASGVLLRAASKSGSLPVRLYPAMAERMARAQPSERSLLHGALAVFRTRDAARLILRDTEPGNDAVLASSAFAALARLSGRADLGADRAAWWAWMQRADAMTESQWRLMLAETQAARADALAAQLAGLTTQLSDVIRRLHLATPAEERPAFLGALLLDERAAIRDVGFELISRELSASGRVNGPVGTAAIDLLRHDDASVRARAAMLVRQISPPGAEEASATALLRETNAQAAHELLLAAARWPAPRLLPAVLGWLESRSGARDAASEAALAHHRAGFLTGEDEARAIEALRSLSDADMTPAGATLLIAAGDDADAARLARVLRGGQAALRQAVGESLLWDADFLDPIVQAAAEDPMLMDAASRAVLLHQPTSDGFARIAALRGPTPESTRTSLLRLARALPATDLLRAIEAHPDDSLREAMLGLLIADTRVMSESADPQRARAIALGTMMLAELRLSQGEAAQSLATLDAVPFVSTLEPTRAGALRCTALLSLGRLEDAASTVAPVEAWLRGLELARGRAHAARIAELIAQRFPNLTPEQRDRLAAERAMISTASSPLHDPP